MLTATASTVWAERWSEFWKAPEPIAMLACRQ